jgi:hypothetical protein
LSPKGVHFASTQYGFADEHGFWEDELVTDLTQALQSTAVLHFSIPCNSATHKVITSGETCACVGQTASVCNLNISQATVGNAAGQAAPLRRVPGFTEPLNDLAPVARSSPRRAESVPSPSMAGNHGQFLWQYFPSDYSAEYSAHTDARHHLIPPSSQGSHLRSFRPTATSLRPCGGGCPGCFFQHPVPGARQRGRLSWALLSTPSPRHQTFRVLRRALLFRNTQFPYRPNPRPRIYTLCTHLRKSFWLPSTHKIQRPSQSLGHSFAVAARVYGRALGFFQRTRSSS